MAESTVSLYALPASRCEETWGKRLLRELGGADGAAGALARRLGGAATLAAAARGDEAGSRACFAALVERMSEIAADLPAAALADLCKDLELAGPAASETGGYPDGGQGGGAAPRLVTWLDPSKDELTVERALKRLEPLRARPELAGDIAERLEALLTLAKRRRYVVLAQV